jgi:hypothetical protein
MLEAPIKDLSETRDLINQRFNRKLERLQTSQSKSKSPTTLRNNPTEEDEVLVTT